VAKTTIKEIDRGWRSIVAQVKAVAAVKPRVRVGVFGSRAQVAEWNEFGTSRIPARPFVRNTMDKNAGRYARFLVDQARAGLGGSDRSYRQALNKLGLLMVGDVQQTISNGVPPPNAPSTIAKKGSSTPLVDTGLMRSEVEHKVDA
jgi:hypothetical protein